MPAKAGLQSSLNHSTSDDASILYTPIQMLPCNLCGVCIPTYKEWRIDCRQSTVSCQTLTFINSSQLTFTGDSSIGHWLLVTGHWTLVSGLWLLVTGHWVLVAGIWSLVAGKSNLVFFVLVLVLGIRNFSRTRDEHEYDDEGRACRAEVITKPEALEAKTGYLLFLRYALCAMCYALRYWLF